MRNNETRLAELRLDNGLKQKEIAKILNVSEDRYSKYERSIDDMTLVMSNKLANYYKVSLDYLYGISNTNHYISDKEIDFSLLCSRLKELRKNNNLSQSELSQKVGFPQTTYSGYESGKSIPTSFKICYIAIYYNVSFDYLVGKSDIKDLS
ncbi:MAG: transcriptional regulator [Bacilli bacterium]|nr:transcriptional regulator [Bacilli bacterium]